MATICSCFNFLIIIYKWRHQHRYLDAIMDVIIFAIICLLFSGSTQLLYTGMAVSAVVSLYLLRYPIDNISLSKIKDKIIEFIKNLFKRG